MNVNMSLTTAAGTTTTITPPTMSTNDVAFALTTTSFVEDQTSYANHAVAGAKTSVVKKTRARRGKIKMEKMEKENNLLVTFSKRKSGLMKKVNELCTMCGVQCALVIFSPAGKVFSFGHPFVDQVADRYLSGNPNPIFGHQNEVGSQVRPHPQTLVQALQHADIAASTEDLIAELRGLEAALEAAKKHGKELDEKKAVRMISCWWERPLHELSGGQIETLKHAIVDLKSKVFDMAKMRLMPLPPGSARPSPSPLSLGLGSRSYPDIHGAGFTSTSISFGGFPRFNNNHAPNNEAGPSGHASGGWSGSSGGAVQDGLNYSRIA